MNPKTARTNLFARLEALRVDRVSTTQHCRRLHALKQELEAHVAVVVHGPLHADVVVLR